MTMCSPTNSWLRCHLLFLVPIMILTAVCRSEPAVPASPVGPVSPVGLVIPVDPISPVGLVSPVGPVEIKIIAPRRILDISGSLAMTPAERATFFREIPAPDEGECRLVIFPQEGLHPFKFDSGTHSVDVLLISRNNRISRVLETVRAGRCYASANPVMAVAVFPEGYCSRNGVKSGHYIDIKDVPLNPVVRLKSTKEDVAGARSMMEQNLVLFPDDPAVKEDLGDFYIGIQDIEAAKVIFWQLHREAPTAYRLSRMAQITAVEGNWTEAVQIIRQALVLDPRSIQSYSLWMKMPSSKENPESPGNEIRSILDKNPDFDELREELAELYLKSNRLDNALSLLQYTSSNEERNAGFQRILGDIHLRQGDFRAAAEAYSNYLRIFRYDPHAPDLHAFITVHAFRKEALGL